MIDDPELSNGGCLLPEVVESSIDAVLVPCASHDEEFTREETPGIVLLSLTFAQLKLVRPSGR